MTPFDGDCTAGAAVLSSNDFLPGAHLYRHRSLASRTCLPLAQVMLERMAYAYQNEIGLPNSLFEENACNGLRKPHSKSG